MDRPKVMPQGKHCSCLPLQQKQELDAEARLHTQDGCLDHDTLRKASVLLAFFFEREQLDINKHRRAGMIVRSCHENSGVRDFIHTCHWRIKSSWKQYQAPYIGWAHFE